MLAAQTTDLLGNRYALAEEIGAGGMGTIYRAVDRLTNTPVAVKRITVAPNVLQFASISDTADTRLALAQEFRTLASLRHPNIISVLDYGFDGQQQPYFVMELLEHTETIVQSAYGNPDSVKLELLTQTLHALAYLHRRGVIHRDLKPDNVLVAYEPERRVRVLDFGLALARGDVVPQDEIGGTLTYLAPEVLMGARPSTASDLYAVGIIAYEMIAARHPFEGSRALVSDIISTEPNLRALDADPRLVQIIGRLLLKDPHARYQDAADVLHALDAITGKRDTMELAELRESFLQAAQFVGRANELGTLLSGLDDASAGQGSAWLVGGESGVGKSRLLDELRARALVRGVTVLRGQALSDGGRPYTAWHDVVRHLALLSQPTELEASVLKPLMPDSSQLLGATVPDAPPLPPDSARTRLLTTILDLVSRQDSTLLLVLEDLHWASEESLDLLRAMARNLAGQRLLIVGSYRDDEAPALPSSLPDMQIMRLSRLQAADIEELSESMLGAAGRQPRILNLLQRETEGNVFFLVEVVRALAEEAGRLDLVGEVTLPEHIFAGGVQRLVQRRLDRVATNYRSLLQAAAVAGRQLDLKLLQALNCGSALGEWLSAVSDAAVIEVSEGGWRFAHDKMREGVLQALSESERTALHRSVAESIEHVYGEAKPEMLAFHWGMAGERAKEAHYAALAGEAALRAGAYHEAVAYLQTAAAYETNHTRESQLGQAHYGLGQLAESRMHLTRSLDLLSYKMPGNLVLGMAKEAAVMAVRRFVPRHAQTVSERDTLLEAARNYGLIGESAYFTTETLLGVYAIVKMLNLARQAGDSPELARAYISLCIAASFIPHVRLADYLAKRAVQVAEALPERAALAQVLNVQVVYLVGMGRWDEADAALNRALEIADAVGDRKEAIQTQTTRAILRHYQGHFAGALALNDAAAAAARRTGNVQQQGWGVYSAAENLTRLGQFGVALERLDTALPIVQSYARSSLIRVKAARAQIMLRLGDLDAAEATIDEAIALMGTTSPNVYSMLDAYATMAEVYLARAEAAEGAERESYARRAGQNARFIKGYARIYPVGQPRALILKGRLARLHGQVKAAGEAFRAALAAADAINMPYERGLALAQLGRHREAADIMQSLGATWEAANVSRD